MTAAAWPSTSPEMPNADYLGLAVNERPAWVDLPISGYCIRKTKKGDFLCRNFIPF
jgi:hypothetical protein